VDTNNITESFNNVLRKRYLPLRHDTTIFAFVQILVEVAFPEQETRYIQTTVKQTNAYRKPRYTLPHFLNDRPHTVQSICLMNIERAKSVPRNFIEESEGGVYFIKSSTEKENWKVEIPKGQCSCPSFLTSHIPCKHMFAVFQHYNWSWHDLPDDLKNSSHMTLDNHVICDIDHQRSCDTEPLMNESPNSMAVDIPSVATSNELPCKSSEGKQVYKLQKALEEALGRCRTLAFLTSDTSVLEDALLQCKTIMDTLTSSACLITGPNNPPVYNCIAKAGVEEFKSHSKYCKRVGIKRKQVSNKIDTKKIKLGKTNPPSKLQKGTLSQNVKCEPGRPRLKRPQRKKNTYAKAS